MSKSKGDKQHNTMGQSTSPTTLEESSISTTPIIKEVLLLSEDETLRSEIAGLLKDELFCLVEAKDSLEALKALKKRSIDVIILDTVFIEDDCEDFIGLVGNVSIKKENGFVFLLEDGVSKAPYQTDLRNVTLPRTKIKKIQLCKSIKQILDPSYDPDKDEKALKGRVLVIESDKNKLESVINCLKEAGLETYEATDGQSGLSKAREKMPDVIMVSEILPDKSGIELVKICKKDPALEGVPSLVLCDELNLISVRTEAYSKGALGCVSYPINKHEVLAHVGVMVKLTSTHAELQENAVTLAVANFELEETKQQLEEKKKELEKSSEYKSEFLAKMSHELRTPLTAMMGFAQKALHTSPQDPDNKSSVRTILRNGEHLLELINDILDLSKIEAGKLSLDLVACSPAEILEDVRALMSIRAEQKGLDFWIEYINEIPEMIISDSMRVKQILLNLVGNSIKFTQKGSVKVCVSCSQEEEVISFQIVDTGIGISEEKRQQLFHAFVQGDTEVTRKFGGTGLGLTISLQLAEMLGGSIEVNSILGMGSSFKAMIKTGPLKNARFLTQVELENVKSINVDDDNIRIEQLSGRILVAEDNPDNQKLLEFYLNKSGVKYLTVSNGQEALRHALDEEFDLVLLDMQMPVMDGYVAAKKLRDRGFVKPIIGLTANNLEAEIKKSIDAGCDKVLSKPYNWNSLFSLLKEYIGAKGTNQHVVVLKPASDIEMRTSGIELESGQDGWSNSGDKNTTTEPPPVLSASDSPILSQMYDDNTDFRPLIIEFLEGLDKYIRNVEGLVKTKKWSDLKAVAHDISGVSGMYGYPECSELAKKLRLSCMQKDDSTIVGNVAALVKCLHRMGLGLKVIRGESLTGNSSLAGAETQVITSELFDVSPELGPEILEFLDNIESMMRKIKEASDSMNWSSLTAMTNEISGTASLFGYPAFATTAKEIEDSVVAGDTSKVPKLLNELSSIKDAMLRGKKQVS